MNLIPLVETTRGLNPATATVENVHFGAVAVVDVKGRVLYAAGDPHYLTFTRSALKPLQALPLILDGGMEQLGFESQDLALFCASHSGEPRHVERVAAILARLGLSESDLQCGCQVPLFYATLGQKVPPNASFTQLHHNCSGKHAGMLAWCHLHGTRHTDYLDYEHPLQLRIRETLLPAFGLYGDKVAAGIDGCSAPNYAVPLSSLAHFYARLAQGVADEQHGEAFGAIFSAMTDFPELVSGEGRTDLAYMSAARGDWISKAGADGVQVIASKERGIGIAIKIGDGLPRALHTAVVGVLDALDMTTEASRASTAAWREPLIKNYKGTAVGTIRSRIQLQKT